MKKIFIDVVYKVITNNYCEKHFGHNLKTCQLCKKADSRNNRLMKKYSSFCIEELYKLSTKKKLEVKSYKDFLNYLDLVYVINNLNSINTSVSICKSI